MKNNEEQQDFIEFCRLYIQSVRWQAAKSDKYKNAPHEYTVTHWNPDRRPWFEHMVMGIRQYGYTENFGNQTYKYLDIDGHKYWTQGAPLYMTILINRSSINNEKLQLINYET
ncbi:MAG: hypothetical protein WD467_00080 [Candidatus Saccharimonadales bacterium]